MKKAALASMDELTDKKPFHAVVSTVDLVVIRRGNDISVLYGRCAHRGALIADGFVRGDDIICGLHKWDYRIDTGISAYNNSERLHKFTHFVEDGKLLIDEDEIKAWERDNPQPFNRSSYQGVYQDTEPVPEEPYVNYIRHLAGRGLKKTGPHGETGAMGVPRGELPGWDDIQFVTAQLAAFPELDETQVGTELVIGPGAKKPLKLSIPIFVSDMSFGALSEEAKVALARGAELSGTGICSGEGGMLPEEKAENSRYFYELASARFGFSWDKLGSVQAFHFKGGQAAKTGTGGHLPGRKVTEKIASVRGIAEGKTAVSPARFPDWDSLSDIKAFAGEVRERTGGIPVGYKLSAQHIEADIDAALEVGVDYIILDGRGGGTGSAPLIFRDHISVPTLPALARARRHLDKSNSGVTLLVTGGLRTPADFAKALALGADGVGISNSAIQAIGCIAMRACQTNCCPVGIATQDERLRARLPVDEAAKRLDRFLRASVDLMKVLARACGHSRLDAFNPHDITTWKREIADLTGIAYAGDGGLR